MSDRSIVVRVPRALARQVAAHARALRAETRCDISFQQAAVALLQRGVDSVTKASGPYPGSWLALQASLASNPLDPPPTDGKRRRG